MAVGLIANAVFVWITDTRLERQLTAIRTAGDPVTLADLARPPIAPETNAATYLRRAQADMAAIEKETMNVHPVSDCPGFRLPPADEKTVKAALTAYPNVIPLLERAAACSDYDAELDYTLSANDFLAKYLDIASQPRSAARVLHHRADLLVAEGNRDEAVRTALLIFKLARLVDRNPMIVAYLVALAIRGHAIESANTALQTGPVSKEVCDALDAELAIQDRMEGFVWAIKSERAYNVESFRKFPGRNFWLVGRGFWNTQESACLDIYTTLFALARDPGPYREIEESIEIRKSVFARLVFPYIKVTYTAVARTRAEIRCLRVLIALQRHASGGGNELPKLTELHLSAESTTDPFTGEALHAKRTPQGWLIYSVGSNLRDDGGNLNDPTNNDVGVGPPPPAKPAAKP